MIQFFVYVSRPLDRKVGIAHCLVNLFSSPALLKSGAKRKPLNHSLTHHSPLDLLHVTKSNEEMIGRRQIFLVFPKSRLFGKNQAQLGLSKCFLP